MNFIKLSHYRNIKQWFEKENKPYHQEVLSRSTPMRFAISSKRYMELALEASNADTIVDLVRTSIGMKRTEVVSKRLLARAG